MPINYSYQKKTLVFFLILALLFSNFSKIIAQNNVNSDKILRYDFATDVTFLAQNNQPLSLALAGGLNSPQFSTIDLNGDSKNDLFIYDRTAKRIFTFLNQNNHYEYAPTEPLEMSFKVEALPTQRAVVVVSQEQFVYQTSHLSNSAWASILLAH